MKIVFLLPGTEGRPKILNGYTIRYGGAQASGTDQSVIMVAEYLAGIGHEITIILHKTDKEKTNGVNYDDFNYNSLIDKEVDVVISMLWFSEYSKLPFKINKGLIYWYHMAWIYGLNEIIEYCKERKLKVGLVNISEWAKGQNQWNINILNEVLSTVEAIIPNPIMTDVLEEILYKEKIEKIKNSTIFHAQFGRGGDVAERIVKTLNLQEMYRADYVDPGYGIDKLTLFKKLLETEYFIFPLYHPNGCVYKDTFSCSVAEAVAAGVKVITYPLGAIPEYFKDYCTFAEFPEGSDINNLMEEKVTCNAQYLNNIEVFVEAFNKCQHAKIDLHKNLNYIKDMFNINIIGNMWVNLLADI